MWIFACVLAAPRSGLGAANKLVIHDKPADFSGGKIKSGEIQPDGVLLTVPIEGKAPPDNRPGVYVGPVIDGEFEFDEALVSLNVDAPPHIGYRLELRVGRSADDTWYPYLTICSWGDVSGMSPAATDRESGLIDIDYFKSEDRWDRAQYRIIAIGGKPPEGVVDADTVSLRIARVAVCLTDTADKPNSAANQKHKESARSDTAWQRRLPVPFRSQKSESKEIAGRVCSPTSVSMMLEYRGINLPTADVAARIYDAENGIYGNWPRAVQAAYSLGAPGYLTRFDSWAQAERMIAASQPIIISIQVKKGELPAAPYKSTGGHLLVVTGFDADGNLLVNDPAARDPEKGQTAYPRDAMRKAWLDRAKGTAYIIQAPARKTPISTPADPAAEALVELNRIDPRIVVDLRYATSNNFTGEILYPMARCFLRETVARRLSRVQDRLAQMGLGLKIYDGYRPLSVQKMMWTLVPDPRYVADPAKGSRHNRGAAVDVTLVDDKGRELEMPTGYDDFTESAHRDYAGGSEESRRNREQLAKAMATEGFEGLATEWWHFDAPGWERYPVMNKNISELASAGRKGDAVHPGGRSE